MHVHGGQIIYHDDDDVAMMVVVVAAVVCRITIMMKTTLLGDVCVPAEKQLLRMEERKLSNSTPVVGCFLRPDLSHCVRLLICFQGPSMMGCCRRLSKGKKDLLRLFLIFMVFFSFLDVTNVPSRTGGVGGWGPVSIGLGLSISRTTIVPTNYGEFIMFIVLLSTLYHHGFRPLLIPIQEKMLGGWW